MPPKKKKKGKKGDKGGADPVKSEANEEEEKKAVRWLPQKSDPTVASTNPLTRHQTVCYCDRAPPHKLTS
jgi:hypothetical protein